MKVPGVEIHDLWSLDGDNAAELTGAQGPSFAGADRHDELVNEAAPFDFTGKTIVEGLIREKRRAGFRFVKWSGHSIVY